MVFYYADTGHAESVTMTTGPGGHPDLADGTINQAQTELPIKLDGSHTIGIPVNDVDNPPTDTTTAITGPSGQFRYLYGQSTKIKVAVGGSVPFSLNATFQIDVPVYKGWGVRNDSNGATPVPDNTTDPLDTVTIDTSDWLDVAFTKTFLGWTLISGSGGFELYSGTVRLDCVVNATVNPGLYSVSLSAATSPNNEASGTMATTDNGDGTVTVTGFNQWNFTTFASVTNRMSITGTGTVTISPGVPAIGIHDSKQVMQIVLPTFEPTSGTPSGIYGASEIYKNSSPTQNGPFAAGFYGSFDQGLITEITETSPYSTVIGSNDIAVTFVREIFYDNIPLDSITSSTPGFWFGKTPPVQSIGITPWDKMPWNMFPTTLPSSGANTATVNKFLGYIKPYVGGKNFTGGDSERAYDAPDSPGWLTASPASELLPWPKRWKALVHYPLGWTVLDNYGNLHQLIFQDARSGNTEPAWSNVKGGVTAEPGYTDVTGAAQQGAQWKCISVRRKAATLNRNTAYTVGRTAIDDNGNLQRCIAAGTTDSASPAWATTIGTNT